MNLFTPSNARYISRYDYVNGTSDVGYILALSSISNVNLGYNFSGVSFLVMSYIVRDRVDQLQCVGRCCTLKKKASFYGT